jgi:ATP-dependent Lon protease
MLKNLKKWINQKLLIFLESRIEIQELKEERDFWYKEANLWISKYSDMETASLELLNVKNFLAKKSNIPWRNLKKGKKRLSKKDINTTKTSHKAI